MPMIYVKYIGDCAIGLPSNDTCFNNCKAAK
jgi:hypothetical protein